jgi:omega-amidase
VPAVGGTVTSLQKAPSAFMLCDVARREKVWIVGGSIPEREGNKVFNTCLVINPEGVIVAKHRKVHLFDINIPGKMVFRESDTLTAGDSVTTVETPWGRVGVGICYDMRFPELATVMRQKGCGILLYPGAFNMTTGPLHWELLQRARAVDNALYVVTVSPSRAKDTKGYVAYGHSSVISPMGEVLADAGTEDRVVVQELDLEKVAAMRQQIPCFNQKRHDLYETISKK